MTPTSINLAIAEACGWKWVPHPKHGIGGYWECGMPGSSGYRRGDWGSKELGVDLPDFLTDLNAMAQAEALLSDEQFTDYAHRLTTLYLAKTKGLSWLGSISATSSERSEMLLRTLHLWTDS